MALEEGEALLIELRRSAWVDPDVDWETVRQGLARGRSAHSVLARDRHQASFGGWYAPDDLRLIEEMTAIARRPFVEMAWPAVPEVDVGRISADFARTTGRALDLELRWEHFPDGGYWVCDLAIDGRRGGWVGVDDAGSDPEQRLAEVADGLCEGWLHEEVWGGWPLCRRHPTRPMWARKDGGRAMWICEADAADRTEIGQLGLRRGSVPRPS